MFGLINLGKPVGPTSHDMVARVRRLLPRRTKVGHAGTLDPFATGVLVICIGPATRLAEYVAGQAKQYEAEVTFGQTSTTDDPEGGIADHPSPMPSEHQLRGVLGEFVGEIEQTPPAHSAILIDGQRAYKLARKGRDVRVPTRVVRIDGIELLGFDGRRARIRVDCGSGTYIRALARDIGARLDCGAYCSALTRTAIGAFRVENAITPNDLDAESIGDHILPPRLALADWPTATVSPEQVAALRQGKPVRMGLAVGTEGTNVATLDGAGNLVALCDVAGTDGWLRPFKVFV